VSWRPTRPTRPLARWTAVIGRRPGVRALVGGLASVGVLLLPTSASAHGGALLGAAEAGPYRVQLMASAVSRPAAGPAIDLTAYVQDATDGRPIEDAEVRIVAEIDGARRALPVQRIGNGYEAIARVPSSSDLQAYPVRVDVAGTAGRTTLTVRPPAGSGPPLALLAGTGVVLLGAAALVVRVRRGRAGGDVEQRDGAT
jgi:hypothetical protein